MLSVFFYMTTFCEKTSDLMWKDLGIPWHKIIHSDIINSVSGNPLNSHQKNPLLLTPWHFYIKVPSTQPASSSHLQLQQYQDQRLSRGREISGSAFQVSCLNCIHWHGEKAIGKISLYFCLHIVILPFTSLPTMVYRWQSMQ
jgi:hypothetical protein